MERALKKINSKQPTKVLRASSNRREEKIKLQWIEYEVT